MKGINYQNNTYHEKIKNQDSCHCKISKKISYNPNIWIWALQEEQRVKSLERSIGCIDEPDCKQLKETL